MATADQSKDATRKLARHAATLRYEALPAPLVEMTKQCILDTLGVSIGASTLAPEGRIIADYVRDLGGKQESTILGFGGKAPAAWAAFVNGSLGHMLDYDDVGEGGHVSISTVPVAFAIVEKNGRASGRDLITSIAAGTDIHTRLALSIDIPDWTMTEGWFATQLFGYISGAATAGRLLELNEAQMENALGVGYNQLSGSRQMAVGAATHMRSMQAGFSGQAAVSGAELARRGIIGCKEIIEGRYGLFKNYIRTKTPYWDQLVGELGARFPLLKTHGFKVWPACAYTRPTNTAVMQIREQYGVTPEEVAAISIIGGTGGTQLLCEPLASKRRPQVSIDGKYSIPFTTAVMMVKGNVTLRDYTERGLNDPAVLAMADKVSYRPDPEGERSAVGASEGAVGSTTVEITTRDGRRYSSRPDGVPGDARNAVGWPMLEQKFRDCLSFSAKAIPASKADRAIDMIRNLERVSRPAEIIELLT
jgi:2-methylcitrate dehydratase PrpD